MLEKDKGVCAICLSPAEQKCSGCQAAHYCSRDHQKQHWKQHKYECSPVRVKQDPKFGRYLEAARDIKTAEIVMKEKPLLTGPSQTTPPVCLGCYKLLEENKVTKCDKCGWPFCSEACSLKEEHKPECFYSQQSGVKVPRNGQQRPSAFYDYTAIAKPPSSSSAARRIYRNRQAWQADCRSQYKSYISITTFGEPHPNYQCITVLRCLYQRDHNEKLWAKLQTLVSHCQERQGTDKWNNDYKMIAQFILKFLKLEGTFTEDEIMRCCGLVQINGHEVPLMEPEYVAVFDRISMVEHSCRANCNKSFTSDGDIIICAGVNIPSGSHVSVCYTDPLWGTEARRHHLIDWFFECTCPRCSDVTEFRTMYSAVKCKQKNCKGYLLPETFLVPILHKTRNTDPKSRNLDDKVWACGSCKDSVTDGIIQQLLQDIGQELSIMPKGEPDACERFITHCSAYLHPNHYYMTDVSLALASLIGQEHELGLAGVTDDRLLLKTHLCKKVADLLETLAPAEIRIRGSLLFELHAAVAETGRRKSLTEGPMVMLGYVTESRKILAESAALLRHEPVELPEGRLCQQACVNLLHMDELIRNLSAALPSPM